MSRGLHVLHAAADARDGAATAGAIEAVAQRLDTRVETGTAAGLEAVRAGHVDCVVVEDDPPAVDGLDRLETFREEGVPVVFVAGDADRARAALDAGAADCVRRDAWDDVAEPVAHRVAAAVDRRGPEADDEPGTTEDDRELSRYRRIIQGVGDILYATDADGEYIHVNPAGARVTGYTVDEILAQGPELVYDEAEIETFEEAIRELLEDEDREVARVEATMQTKDGGKLPVEATLTIRYNSDGSFAGTIGVARDMTERKARERELSEYESIVRALPDEVAILDTEGYITRYIPPAGSERGTSGYRPEELHGEHVSTVMTDESVERGAELIEELVTTDRERGAFEMAVVGKDGETHLREDHLALLEDEDGTIQGTVGVLRDIEDRKAYERELERYARLIEASGDAVYALDPDGRFTFSNDAHLEMVDRPEEELLGAHASIALPEQAVRDGEQLIQELLKSDRRHGTFEMDVLKPDGTRIPTENHLALLTDEDGEFRGTVGVLRDISDRQAREQELQRQNARLERFAEIASHDLRNPLNVAQGYLQMLREETDSEHAGQVAEALDRMDRLIDDTLTMARQGATVDEPSAVALGALVPDCWDAVGSESGSLEVVDDVTVMADENRLQQVLENLLRNAVEHGGEDVSVRIGAIDGAGFYVEDDGPGIPPDQREAVFEAGHTTAASGTGFGLAIVSEIADAHGWDIAVGESTSGGARFEITGVDVHE